jgi:lipoprotein-anchoring transpeptidase ErfK/SrfK
VSTASACVKLSTNQAWLIRDGKAVYGPVKITHGRKGWLTPTGSFKVYYKNRKHRSRLFDDAPMPNSVFFNGGIAFHSGSLSVLSHGCIHLSPAASERFYGLPIGAQVQVVR